MNADTIAYFRGALTEARALFDKSSEELREAERRVFWLKRDLSKLRQTITALAAMCSEAPWTDALGITDSCMEVMDVETKEVSTQDVVAKLEAMGFDFSSQKNPAASVHAVLGRLAEKGKIKKTAEGFEGVVTWRGPNYEDPTPHTEEFAGTEITDDDIPF